MDEPAAHAGGDAQLPGRSQLLPPEGQRAHVLHTAHVHLATAGNER
ncbi:hypothetical protein [Microbacterium suwonense]|nr:hypothetical protein [Microbacterium suwonense]